MGSKPADEKDPQPGCTEQVEVSGHIIDSLILPKVLDTITARGGAFKILQIAIGQDRSDPSHARIEVRAADRDRLVDILAQIADHGAVPVEASDCTLVEADMDGVFPEGFYSTTNCHTEVRIEGRWREVADQEMDCAVVVTDAAARCVAMTDVRRGDRVVVGHAGTRVQIPKRSADAGDAFAFMNSEVSTEKPKAWVLKQLAQLLHDNRGGAGQTLVVGGPAVIHTGSGPLLASLVRGGYIHKLFAGNALATHDIEQALYGTSLGVHLEDATLAHGGHEHHLRTINRIRRCGSIAAAVEQGVLKSGVMHDCVRHGVDYVLAGSIRDDGPLPDVITDTVEAQRVMRSKLPGVTLCLMIATTLHSIAVCNLLPAWVKVVCIDINPSTPIKLSDRGSFQTVGLVTDVEPFLRALVDEVQKLDRA